MANIMSSMKIPIQKLVSKKKKRYTEDGFNLDLAYILPNLIAMGFPANKIEGVYRNHIDEVYRFLEMKHDGVYKIYNLCSERRYDSNKFHSRVARYPFHDHNPPNIEQIQAFCDDVHQWLNANPKHIAAVHCKAGKGRTGTMICCYMLHNRRFVCANEALLHYGEQRTHDQKGVTIPSQRRYVEYYSHLLKSGQPYARVPLQICEMRLSSPPLLNNHPGSIYFSISYVSDTNEYPLYTSEVPKASNSTGNLVIGLDRCIALAGDIKVEFFNKRLARKNSVLFRFWFNTYFVNELHKDKNESCNQYLEYVLTKNEIDYAHKDTHNKMYPPDFKVLVTLQRTPAGSYVQGPEQDIHQLQYQAAAVAAAAAAAAAAASTDHHHKHHPLQPHNHHAQHPAQPFSNLHHNHHYSNSNHHQPVAQPPLHPHLPVTIQTTTTTSSPPSMVAGIGGPVGSPQPQQENHMYHHNNLHHMHTHPNHLSHHHLHHHSHRHAQAPLLQQTNSCDLSLGEGGTDEECSHHPTPSDSPEASSSGGSSTGEDWESDTHKSHPTDTNSTTSTITTTSTTTNNNNNYNSSNTISTSNNNNHRHHSSSVSTTITDSGADVDSHADTIGDEYDDVFEPKNPSCRSPSATSARDAGLGGATSSVNSTPASSPRHSSPSCNPLVKSYSAANSFFRSKRRLSIFPPAATTVPAAAGASAAGPAIAISSPTSPTLPGCPTGDAAAHPSLTNRSEGGMFAIFARHFVRRKST